MRSYEPGPAPPTLRPDAKLMFEIYRERGPLGRYRVIYFTELDEHEREPQIERALAGQHVFDGFIADDRPQSKDRIEALLARLNGGADLNAETIRLELTGALV